MESKNIETEYGTFRFKFYSTDKEFAETAIDDVLFHHCGFIAAELSDFSRIFRKAQSIQINKHDMSERKKDTLKYLDGKDIGIVFYTSTMKSVVDFCNSFPDVEIRFMKAFSNERNCGIERNDLQGSCAIFCEDSNG